MARGGAREGAGRKLGGCNKDVAQAREAVTNFFASNVEKFQEWLDKVAEDSPEKAFRMVFDLMEFHLPKLARTEVTGKDGDAVEIRVTDQTDQVIIDRYLNKMLEGKKNE